MHIVVAVLLQIGRFAEKFTNIWGNIPIVKCYGFVIHLLRRGAPPGGDRAGQGSRSVRWESRGTDPTQGNFSDRKKAFRRTCL